MPKVENNLILDGDPSDDLGAATKQYVDSTVIPDNLSATRMPTVSDDTTLGWKAGSRWYATIDENTSLYVCFDNTEGAAIWVLISGGGSGTVVMKELLMQDGVSSPPVPLETEDGTDWLYQD